jgi:diaminopimelate decarboxylase
MSAAASTLASQLLAEGFGQQAGELLIGGVPVTALAAAHGTPLYVMDETLLRQRHAALCEALSGFAEVYYSIKANPQPAVARLFVEAGAGLKSWPW